MKTSPALREWRIASADRSASRTLAEALDLPPLAGHLLAARGIDSEETAQRFLAPSPEHLSDPTLLSGVEAAVKRIRTARERSEHVLVFGDYDVDGIAGAAIMVNALRRFGIQSCSHGMPNRLTEGYGISPDRVLWAKEQGARVIITVDNGITAQEAAETAREQGIDLIVTDHHQPETDLPHALALINPKLEGPDHPARDICGAAVAFKLAQALTGEMRDLDIVALGTVADLVPLEGENRTLVACGIAQAIAHPRVGLKQLARVSKVDLSTLTAEGIAFQLAPRINAGGRMGDGLTGLKLLLSESASEAAALANELNAANRKRREIENTITEEALEYLETHFDPSQRSIVIAKRGWHPGVIGIVASRLQSYYYRPTVLVGFGDDGLGQGSARSIDGLNIADALTACRSHLMTNGGHAAAAGLTMKRDCVQPFREAFENESARHLPEGALCKPLDIDAPVAFSELDSHLLRSLDRLEPFGRGNPSPVFCTCGVQLAADSCRELRGGHLRATFQHGPTMLQAIGFRMGARTEEVASMNSLDVAFTPQFNTWRGETTIQLVLRDIRPA